MSDLTHRQVIAELQGLADPERAANLKWFFKTGPGEYGEGDVFLGLRVGMVREAAKKFRNLPLSEVEKVIARPEHEVRQAGLFILVERWRRAGGRRTTPEAAVAERREIYKFYLAHTARVNNWDLVDLTAPTIVGQELLAGPRDEAERVLTKLAKSDSLWERRIAMIACFAFIDKKEPELPFKIVEMLSGDRHDLIHKATGWMLREIGKKCGQDVLEDWLRGGDATSGGAGGGHDNKGEQDNHGGGDNPGGSGGRYKKLPRTMLRYAIERFEPELRQRYLKGEV